jgi:hypothetical protein
VFDPGTAEIGSVNVEFARLDLLLLEIEAEGIGHNDGSEIARQPGSDHPHQTLAKLLLKLGYRSRWFLATESLTH